MRIGFVVTDFPSTTETFILNQITDLIKRGHEVKIFAFCRKDNAVIHKLIFDYNLLEHTFFYEDCNKPILKRYFPFLKYLSVNLASLNYKRILGNFNFLRSGIHAFNLRFFYKYFWILRHGYFNVIHAHFGPNGAYIADIKKTGFLRNTKIVTTFHGYDLQPKFLNYYNWKYKTLFVEGDIFTVNTPYMFSIIEKVTSLDKTKLLPVGLDSKLFHSKNIRSSQNLKLLFVGRLVSLKAPIVTIQLLKVLVKKGYSNLQLIIVGEGEEEPLIKSLVKEYNLEDSVFLMGSLNQLRVRELMEQAHILVMPGIHDETGRAETQGLVIQEAQAMELPVVVSDAGGMKYGLLDGETGFVIKEGDIEGFADKIELLLRNEKLRKEMGRKGREFVVANYDSSVLGDQLEKLYFDL